MTELVQKVSGKIWEALGNEGTLDEQTWLKQFDFKRSILPFVYVTAPVVEESVKQKMINIINKGAEDGLDEKEVLLALTLELS